MQALGKTTREMRDNHGEGDSFDDFVGPLGLPQHVAAVGHVVLMGGGLGVAPVFPQLRAFKQAGSRTTCIVGFRSKPLAFWGDELAAWSDELIVCTDHGSAGRPGLVTDALAELLAREKPDLVIAIGPMPMMRACTETTRPHGVRTLVSLNTIMVDGTGMCGSCRVSVRGEVKFACVEWECDTVIYALGTRANPIIGRATKGLGLNKWGCIVADDATQATNLRGVFAGGDIVTGGATVILAMSAGRRAARAIAAYLKQGRESWSPSAADVAAFVPPTPLARETAP